MTSPSRAELMSGVWNAPPTLRRRRAAHPDLLGPGDGNARHLRACPRSRPGPGALSLATHAPSGAAAHASAACSMVAPKSAAIRPGCASAAAWVSSARRAANRTPSSRSSTPAAMSAVTWPSEWPRTQRRRRSSGGRLPTRRATCRARRVARRGCGRDLRRWRRGAAARAAHRARLRPARRPSTRDGPAHGAPIPGACVP